MLLSAPALLFALCFILSGSFAARIPPRNVVRSTAIVPDGWTNAQRLAAGLPPLAPRSLRSATRTEPGLFKRAVPSASPSPLAFAKSRVAAGPDAQAPQTGRIAVRTVEENLPVGFVQLSSSIPSLHVDDGARVSLMRTPGSSLFSIAMTTPSRHEPTKFLGATGTSAIALGSGSSARLSHVPLTAPHAHPGPTGSQSAIWTLNPNTQRLNPHFVNPDGSHPRTILAYSAEEDAFVFTGDIHAYNRAHPDASLREVALYLVRD